LNEKDILLEKAKNLLENEEFEKAIKILEDLHQVNPDNDVKFSLIDTLFAYARYLNDDYVLEFEKSINYFKRIIDLDPENYRAYYNLGIAYFNLEKYKEALNSYETALSIKPDYKHGYYNIGLLYEATDNLEDALKAYEKALKIDSKYIYAIHAKKAIEMEMGNRVENKKEVPETMSAIEKIKSLLRMSKRVRLDMIQEILKVNKETLLHILINWGEKKYCKIDGDYLIINKESQDKFIEDLNQNDLAI
jgi:tetratricopeptide (TPR) repeat protein